MRGSADKWHGRFVHSSSNGVFYSRVGDVQIYVRDGVGNLDRGSPIQCSCHAI